jgi:hypothetical protein
MARSLPIAANEGFGMAGRSGSSRKTMRTRSTLKAFDRQQRGHDAGGNDNLAAS